MKSRRALYCANCKEGMPKQYVFQGVVICENCYRMVSRCVERARKELEMLFLTYTDMLRVALIKGEMNFPVLPKGTRMPRSEMEAAFINAARRIGGDDAQGPEAEGNGGVRPLRGEEADPGGEVQRGGRPQGIPWRRNIRPVPPVQKGRSEGGSSSPTGADPSEGVAPAGGVDGKG